MPLLLRVFIQKKIFLRLCTLGNLIIAKYSGYRSTLVGLAFTMLENIKYIGLEKEKYPNSTVLFWDISNG